MSLNNRKAVYLCTLLKNCFIQDQNSIAKKKLLAFCLVFVFISFDSAGQANYYWSGGNKILLEIDSTRILVYLKDQSDVTQTKTDLGSFSWGVPANECKSLPPLRVGDLLPQMQDFKRA